jgi:hypothetical protein
MKKDSTKRLLLLLSLISIFVLPVTAAFANGVGTIRIDPWWPTTTNTPATFEIWVQPGGDPTADAHIFLVMTEESYDGIYGNVIVSWDGSPLVISIWTEETIDVKKIPIEDPSGPGYTVDSLKSHLGTSGPIYWAWGPFLSGPITGTKQSFTVTLPSTHPRMLVYALGKTGDFDEFNNRVPPTNPGFVVPESFTIAAIAIPLATLMGYRVMKRKNKAI